ncbi:cyclin-dependent kinase 4 [Arctopsyche grandis]|uniref:cyclin-dependent kinase 4 n=1 Tax=Arctopsyche grandis TaxID=121162 RepID=UPI00406D6BC8
MSNEAVDSSTCKSPHTPPFNVNTFSVGDIASSSITTRNNYKEISLIGTGAYGTVFKAEDSLNPGVMVAMKKVRVTMVEDGVPLSTLREIALLKQIESIQHPNIVRLLDVCLGQQPEPGKHLTLFLVFEHCKQDLASYMEKAPIGGLSDYKIWYMSKEIISGIDFLHSQKIVHRDLKPQNLLVTADEHIKLADFGLAKTYDSEMRLTSVVVTLWYRPPEVLLGRAYHSAVDMWSAAAVLYEMHSLTPLFPGRCESDQIEKIFRVIGCPPKNLWVDIPVLFKKFQDFPPRDLSHLCPRIGSQAKDMLQKMLCFDPSQRLTAMQCLEHPYFLTKPSPN